MIRDDFWKLIETSRRGAIDIDEQIGKRHDVLGPLAVDDILSFDTWFQECIRDACTRSAAEACCGRPAAQLDQ